MESKNHEERMKDFLYRNKDYVKTSRVIRDLWILRRNLLKKLKEGELQQNHHQAQQNLLEDKTNPPQSGPPMSSLLLRGSINSPQSDLPQDDLKQRLKINQS